MADLNFFFCSASQNNYRIDANQELLAIGVTNIMGSFVSAYPVTGSFGRFVCLILIKRSNGEPEFETLILWPFFFLLDNRTAVNSQTGACTPAGGIVTSEFSSSYFIISALEWSFVLRRFITRTFDDAFSPCRLLRHILTACFFLKSHFNRCFSNI